MKKILKEPLAHFLLFGLALFALYGLVNKEDDSADTIVIDDFDMNNIIASWEMQWKRLPSDEELKSLIQQNIKQEIFYQEALKMNLDHNDEIIKRRLAQKMQFLSNDLATISEPSEEELMNFYNENVNNYLSPYSYSFYQIIFSPDHRSDPKKDAQKLMGAIHNTDPTAISNEGDSMPFPYFFKETDAIEVQRRLGNEFSEELEELPVEQWLGPIKSGFGYHLVYILERTDPQKPEFESIRNELVRDLEYRNQQKLDQLIFEELKKKYNIEYELDPEKFDESFVEYLKE
ncbi:peptidyl-prolyl cis-trans isomerase [Lutimonas saemankumensis]|uniref:peptidylprolyl isomerase n=1 Tax=Lutimonas saemankumensis TaxID=483016 RepID=UPI001CD566B0|nr:peptidylprolyl isomerase [Lutimonas saemankumensis]MCA0931658.1 peptidyl-prolyl cis-trans isomerase [Lutimonas saemankumensis]